QIVRWHESASRLGPAPLPRFLRAREILDQPEGGREHVVQQSRRKKIVDGVPRDEQGSAVLRDFLFEPDLRRLVEPVDESEGHGLGRGGFFFPARKKQARKDDGKSRPLPGAGDFPNDLYRAEVRV